MEILLWCIGILDYHLYDSPIFFWAFFAFSPREWDLPLVRLTNFSAFFLTETVHSLAFKSKSQ